jgi:hypothetical protein
MTEIRSRITCPVDFDKNGKQIGHLRLPFSSNTSAYGWIGIPIAVIRNGSGPTVYLNAGNHGDEYEGQLTLTRLIDELDPAEIQGRLIVLPALNLPAAMSHSRCSPIDGGNLNRSFPGEPDAPDHRPTGAIAYWVTNVVVPLCDALLDLHSGGKTLDYVPSALIRRNWDDEAHFQRKLAALRAFGAPIGYIVEGGSPSAGGGERSPTLNAHADARGIVSMGTELGGAGTVTLDTLHVARRGVYNFLAHLGVLERSPYAGETPEPRLLTVAGPDYYVHAPCRGAFEPAFRLGDEVETGQLCGRIHQIDDPAAPPVEVRFERAGVAFCKRPIVAVERGDCLAHLGTDWPG